MTGNVSLRFAVCCLHPCSRCLGPTTTTTKRKMSSFFCDYAMSRRCRLLFAVGSRCWFQKMQATEGQKAKEGNRRHRRQQKDTTGDGRQRHLPRTCVLRVDVHTLPAALHLPEAFWLRFTTCVAWSLPH